MDISTVIVLTPPHTTDAGLAIAAWRAGARGVLDLEFVTDRAAVESALRRMERFGVKEYGVKLGEESFASMFEQAGGVRWVVLAGGDGPGLSERVERWRRYGAQVLFEATTLAEAARGEELECDGLILKGHESGGRVGGDSSFLLLQKWIRRSGARGDRPALPIWVHGGIGPNTAAACRVAGAAGVVLDAQLLLTRESPLPPAL